MRKFLITIGVFLLAVVMAHGQGGAVSGEAIKSTAGQAASVRVCTAAAISTPCTILASIYSDPELTVPKTNPIATDIQGNYSYYAATGEYKEQITALGVTRERRVTVYATPAYVDVRVPTVVDGTTYPRTDAGIQAAINATLDGGRVLLSPGTYDVCNALPITITKAIDFGGVGDASKLNVCAELDSTKDIILVQPATVWMFNLKLHDFFIMPESGTPGRYGIHFDGTTGTVDNATIEHVRIGLLGNRAIYADGSGNGNGIPRISTIRRNILSGGIAFPNAGDTIVISENQIDGDDGSKALDVTFQAGASSLVMEKNNIVSKGGIRIGGYATATKIIGNEFETPAGTTGSNGAYLDIDGQSASVIADSTVIRDNSFQIINSIAVSAIRVNYANETLIEGNRFLRGSGVKDIVITADATYTKVGHNSWISGGTVADMLDDASNSTAYDFWLDDEHVLKNNTSFLQLDETGTKRSIFRTENDGTVYFYGYHGTPLLRSGDGVSYLYDGAGNIAASFNAADFSALVADGTFSTFAHLKATQGVETTSVTASGAVQGASYSVGATAGVDKVCTGAPTAMTVTKGIITSITCP